MITILITVIACQLIAAGAVFGAVVYFADRVGRADGRRMTETYAAEDTRVAAGTAAWDPFGPR